MSDQELDDLFKSASGKVETPFDASDWQKMETLLDAKGSLRPSFWNWKTYTIATILLLLGVTSVVLISTNDTEEKKIELTQTELNSSQTDSINSDNESAVKKNLSNEDLQKINSSIPKKERIAEQNDKREKGVFTNHEKVDQKREDSYSEQTEQLNALNRDDNIESKSKDKSIDSDKELASNNVVKDGNQTDMSNIISENVANVNEVITDTTKVGAPKERTPSDSTEKARELIEESKKKDQTRSFSLKLALSPDFSSVGYFTPGKTGFNYGLLAEYALGKHVSVSTGGIWSKKLYSSESVESSGYGQVTGSKKIDGDCRILDVPVNVNYYFNPGHSFTVYGSLGLSSYIMFREDYNYDVVKSGKSYTYSSHIERKNNEWFKMANVSMGLQYRLSNHWYLQAEPFVKAPLTGIGEGKIKLVSSGVFVNVKYTFK